jgi:outer membrane protein OmpA-like peptidoglycan-associated protein
MSPCWRVPERTLAAALLAALLGSCVTQSGVVVLLPERDGRDAALTIQQGEEKVLLDRSYAAANLTSWGPRKYELSPDEVQSRFGAALAAQPMRPMSFTLHFVAGGDELTDESKATLETMFVELARYPVADVVVVGHADRVGTDAINDPLSRKRAEAVRALLIARGLAPESIVAIGRGSREPLVPTAEGVDEPRNRRAEVVVR